MKYFFLFLILFAGSEIRAQLLGFGYANCTGWANSSVNVDSLWQQCYGEDCWYPETAGEEQLLYSHLHAQLVAQKCTGGGYGDPGMWMEPMFLGTTYLTTYCQAPTNSVHDTRNFYRITPHDAIIDSLYAFHHTMDTLRLNKASYAASDSIILTFTRHGHHFDQDSSYL
ncbi:MAG TPA: hypothetical protein VL651_13520, partial [Bacteroidia bacterium]|nr:hypothetical protein [Bacteroidia bacterium]